MTLVVFTDLDGTLLDHASYSFDAARPALDRLKRQNVPLVLASSKTAAEVAELHSALDLGDTPAIVENGAGIYEPGAPGGADTAYDRLRAALDTVPTDLRTCFTGFGDLSVAQVADHTGLPVAQAALAKTRQHSEPGLWTGDAAQKTAFTDYLRAYDISAIQGGRYFTLSFGRNKVDGLRDLATRLGATCTVALGDAPNDLAMLNAADHAILVRNDHGPDIAPQPGETTGQFIRSTQPGPSGWNDSLIRLLDRLDHIEV